MSKEELFKKYQEIVLKTNGGADDYVVALCRISNLIKEFAEAQDQQITDLQSQLAEKDKEIAYMTKQAKKFNNEAQKYYEDAYCNDFQKQTKISFAVEQLEKARKLVDELLDNCGNKQYKVWEVFGNQIKAIKEWK